MRKEIYGVWRRQAYVSLTFSAGLKITYAPFLLENRGYRPPNALWGRDGRNELVSECQLCEVTMLDFTDVAIHT